MRYPGLERTVGTSLDAEERAWFQAAPLHSFEFFRLFAQTAARSVPAKGIRCWKMMNDEW